jgi:hypothetical protein
VKVVMKWVCVTIGLTALWMVTRAVVFYFVGVVAVFATAFQATVHALTKISQAGAADETHSVPELRVQRDVRLTPSLIDLAAAEEPQKSVV